jgi:hypothetical protein
VAVDVVTGRMKLFHKGLLFLLAVSVAQIVLFASFTGLLIHSDQEARRARQSKTLITSLWAVQDQIFAGTVTLGMLALSKNKQFIQQRFDEMSDGVVPKLAALRRDVPLTKEQDETLKSIAGSVELIVALMKECKEALDSDPVGIRSIRLKQVVDYEILPHLVDLRTSIVKMEKQEKNFRGAASEDRARVLAAVALSGLLFGNLLTIALIVLGFSKTVTLRLNIIADNIKFLAAGKQLHKTMEGGDEISLVDRTFHNMADALVDAAQKDKAVFANMTVGLVTCGSDGGIESLNPKAESLLNR